MSKSASNRAEFWKGSEYPLAAFDRTYSTKPRALRATALSSHQNMASSQKRKANEESSQPPNKRQRKQWRVTRQHDNTSSETRSIQPGDSGIWATCDKGRERKCIGELRDLFTEYVDTLYGEFATESTPAKNGSEVDIESDIQAEINGFREAERAQLFMPIKVDVQCGRNAPCERQNSWLTIPVVFFKTEAPIEPVSLVKRICEDAMKDQAKKRTRFVKRLSPMTLMGRASEDGLDSVARTVLAPYFHGEPYQRRKVRRSIVTTR